MTTKKNEDNYENMTGYCDIDTGEVDVIIGITEETNTEALQESEDTLESTLLEEGYIETSDGVFEKPS